MPVALFDVDGTLIRAGSRVHRDAFMHALREIYGIHSFDVRGLNPGGRTDRWLLLEALQRSGVDATTAQSGVKAAFASMSAYYLANAENLRALVLPGVIDLLARLRDERILLGLLTGNLETIAYAKMEQAGLTGFFQFGGFGSESVVRADLIDVAIEKAKEMQASPLVLGDVVVVGDTPHDVEAGKHHGMRTLAVVTGPYDRRSLEMCHPDLIVADLSPTDMLVEWMGNAGGTGDGASQLRSSA